MPFAETWMKLETVIQSEVSQKRKRNIIYACMHAQSCLTLCEPMDCSLPGSSVQAIFQARILEWMVISSSRGSCQPKDQTLSLASPALAGGFFATLPPGKPISLIWRIQKNGTDERTGKAETQSQL